MKKKISQTPGDDDDKEESNYDTPAPLPMNQIELFEKKYNKGEMILDSNDFIIYSGEEKETKKNIIIKEYKPEFVNKMKDNISLFDIEMSDFKKFKKKNNKYICKFIECFKSKEKIIFVLEKFTTTLRNEIIRKKKFEIEEIRCFLLKLNEMIKYLLNKNIIEVVFSPDTIGINRKDKNSYYTLNIFNLFPYHRLKQIKKDLPEFKNDFYDYISNDFPFDIILKKEEFIDNENSSEYEYKFSKILSVNSALLWNIGVLIYELYFGELPFEKNDNKKIIKLKKSNNVEFDDLIENLLLEEDKRIKWKEYLKHKFIINIKPEEVFKIILDKNLEKSDKEIDLCENNIDDNIASVLLKMKFDNLMILNLSNNVIENIEMDNGNKEFFRNVKFMNLENNKLKALSVDVLNKLSKLEYLFLSNNNLNNLETFQEMNLSNLNYLSLAQNKLVNISHLSKVNLNNLNILNLSFNNIENISCLQKMNIPYLEELKLANNNIYNIDCLENINLPKLKSLDLKHNKIKSIEVLENVNFPDLEILNLDNNDISDINSLKNLSFNETLKELNLKNNQIKEFSLLNNIYFPSLTKVNLLTFNNNNIDQQLKILSIKLRLYGYKLNSINNGSISILIAPFNITKSEIWENKLFDYTNSFKINANIGANQEEIIYFFLSKVLEMNDSEIIKNKNLINFKLINLKEIYKDNDENEIGNYSILTYIDDNNIISDKNKINSFYLIKQYEQQYKENGYYKLPYFINSLTPLSDISDIKDICPLKKKIRNSYLKASLVDDTESFSSFIKENNYYDKLPIIFINSEYYKGILKFLNKNPKYKKYKDKNSLKKLLINSSEKYIYNHFNDNNNIIAEVVENIDYYSLEKVTEIINGIKLEIPGNYKKIINDWIITVFELINECFLFVLNINLFYDICSCCKSPLLYLNNSNSKNPDGNNEEKNKLFDNILFKSIQIYNSIFEIISPKFNPFSIADHKKIFFGDNPKIYQPANPPKKDNNKFINVIYHDENHNNNYFMESINKDAIELRNSTNGTFIFSNSEDSFKLIIKGIKNYIQNDENIKFLLITTGRTFEKVYNILNQENCIQLIYKACIFCLHKDKHIDKLNKYPNLLKAIYNTKTDVGKFILENSSENNKIFEVLTLVTYKDYVNEFYKLHEIISKNYKNNQNDDTYQNAITLLQNFINQENYKIRGNKLFEGLKAFLTNDGRKIIYEYSNETYYKDINHWLLNLNNLAYEKAGYFIGQLMYKLNEYGNENNLGYKENKPITLYRGIYINYLDALSYQIHLGKKICFQTFLSTSKNEDTAIFFAKEKRKTADDRKDEFKFSLLMEIEHNWNEGLFPLCFYIAPISKFQYEEEYLFHPYTFFKITGFFVDYEKFIIKLKLVSINKKEILEEKINKGNNKIYYNKIDKIIEVREKSTKNDESESD